MPKVKFDINPNPSELKGENKPVDSISYVDALEFYSRLSQKTGKPYRLPTADFNPDGTVGGNYVE